VSDENIHIAMAAVGLAHLAHRLDEQAEWSTVLSGGEQQRIGFARVLINRPTILMLDDAVSRLGSAEAHALYDQIVARLPEMIVISTGQSAAQAGAHRHAIKMNGGIAEPHILSPATSTGVVPSAAAPLAPQS
jgi:putative ATP-binding cassette transporter